MSLVLSGQAINAEKQDISKDAKSNLIKLAAWINERNIPFLITSIGMIVMLLWAGSYKMTAPGAEGIVPLVSNSPLISWHFKLFGPYIGSDLIGITEIAAALFDCRRLFQAYSRCYRWPHYHSDVLYHQHYGYHYTRRDHFRSPHKVYEFFWPLSLQGCHLARGIVLPDQLFRQQGYPLGKQRRVNDLQDKVRTP